MSRKNPKKSSPVTARQGVSVNIVLTTIVVVIAVAVIGGILLFQRSDEGNGDALVPAGSHTLSTADDGKVTLVEFLDFQCPGCASYYTEVTKKIEQDYHGRITFVTRNFPLEMHPLAVVAAQAAEAAAKQGKYNEMYHALYDNVERWAIDGQNTRSDRDRAVVLFEEFATGAGIDRDRFRADMNSADVQAVIDRDVADARTLGVSSTPTFFLNGKKFEPKSRSFAGADHELRAQIDAALTR